MFQTILGFGDQLFTSIVLILSAAVSAHIAYGIGSRKARELFLFLILLLGVSVQYYYILEAIIYLPASKYYVYKVSNCFTLVKYMLS